MWRLHVSAWIWLSHYQAAVTIIFGGKHVIYINLLAPELFSLILAQPVYKIWIIQEPNMLELWNKLHFEEKETESINHV